MATSFIEAFKNYNLNDALEKEKVKRAHEENWCHELGRDILCPYCEEKEPVENIKL